MASKTVTFSEQVNVVTDDQAGHESDFDYVESTSSSEFLSSDDEEDAAALEAIYGAALHGASPTKSGPSPVERQSLLLLDKDLLKLEEDLEISSQSGKYS